MSSSFFGEFQTFLLLSRMTRLGKILQFWLLIKGEIWFVVCILRVQKDFVGDVLDLKIEL
jgi:hypothetical protein